METRSGRKERNSEIISLTEAEINSRIADTVIAHEIALTNAGRLITAPGGGNAPTSSMYQYINDSFKGYLNTGDKIGLILFNKAIEPLKDENKFTFNQYKAVNLLFEKKTQSEKFKWGKTINSVQVIPNDLTSSINNSDIQSLLIYPNMIPLDSVRIATAVCWGTYDMNVSPHAKIPTKLLANYLDPANDLNDLKLLYERVRRTMIAKKILEC